MKKLGIPPSLRDFQAEWESPAFGLFQGAGFSTALLPTNTAIEPEKQSQTPRLCSVERNLNAADTGKPEKKPNLKSHGLGPHFKMRETRLKWDVQQSCQLFFKTREGVVLLYALSPCFSHFFAECFALQKFYQAM
ncbi:MAG TPA: hypothetical protein VNE63_11430, partial [Candidatus Acidoferrales bacterium]|nr:hypothetical protein [Candidatus Acidoferrales bacterium]